MTEITDRITPEMSEEEVLGVLLDEIMGRAEPDVAEAIRFCAIPHWFNEEIIAWLRGEGLKPSRRSREILAALTELTFVGPYYERGWAYHENVRDLLLRRWRERDGQEFKELSGRSAGYFEQRAEAATDEERDAWEREQMYHLLMADEERGLKQFHSMFTRARDFYQLSTCTLLLQLAAEQSDYLARDSQLWAKHSKGELAYYSAQWAEAQRVFEELMGQELPPRLESSVTHLLGMVYRARGKWDRAIEYFGRSLAIKEKVGDEHGMAPTFQNLGSMYKDRGEWDRAIEYFERSLAVLEKVRDEHGMAVAFNNLGLVYQAKEEWNRAIEYYERSLAITRKIGNEYVMARTFNNLGSVYQDKGEWERAIAYYERSLAIMCKIGDEYGMATTFNNLGSVYRDKGEWEQAIEYYEHTLEVVEKVGDEHKMAFGYNNIARLYQDQGRLEEAIPLFEKSVEILERIGDEYHAKIVWENLAKAKREREAKKGQG
jgi:tetratricopeptide (TPR) repeat protein